MTPIGGNVKKAIEIPVTSAVLYSGQSSAITVQDADGDVDAATTIGCYGVGYGVENAYGRVFVPGAFAESIQELNASLDTKPLPIGWMHDIPIGKFTTLRDELKGPYLEGQLSGTSAGQDAGVLAADGLTAVSVGFVAQVYQWADKGELVSFDTPYGKKTYQADDYVLYVVKAQLVECSMVLVGADDEARITVVQSLLEKADRALPGLATDASWEDVAYSMALLMGGRGASAFQELPELEHRSLYERLSRAYTKFSKTPPAYSLRPQYRDVEFQHDERATFQDRYLRKSLAAVTAGAAGVEGQLSPETREEADRAIQALQALTARRDPAEILASMSQSLVAASTHLKGTNSHE